MSVTIHNVKCACSDCICIVAVEEAIENDSRMYCSDECAHHHTTGAGATMSAARATADPATWMPVRSGIHRSQVR